MASFNAFGDDRTAYGAKKEKTRYGNKGKSWSSGSADDEKSKAHKKKKRTGKSSSEAKWSDDDDAGSGGDGKTCTMVQTSKGIVCVAGIKQRQKKKKKSKSSDYNDEDAPLVVSSSGAIDIADSSDESDAEDAKPGKGKKGTSVDKYGYPDTKAVGSRVKNDSASESETEKEVGSDNDDDGGDSDLTSDDEDYAHLTPTVIQLKLRMPKIGKKKRGRRKGKSSSRKNKKTKKRSSSRKRKLGGGGGAKRKAKRLFGGMSRKAKRLAVKGKRGAASYLVKRKTRALKKRASKTSKNQTKIRRQADEKVRTKEADLLKKEQRKQKEMDANLRYAAKKESERNRLADAKRQAQEARETEKELRQRLGESAQDRVDMLKQESNRRLSDMREGYDSSKSQLKRDAAYQRGGVEQAPSLPPRDDYDDGDDTSADESVLDDYEGGDGEYTPSSLQGQVQEGTIVATAISHADVISHSADLMRAYHLKENPNGDKSVHDMYADEMHAKAVGDRTVVKRKYVLAFDRKRVAEPTPEQYILRHENRILGIAYLSDFTRDEIRDIGVELGAKTYEDCTIMVGSLVRWVISAGNSRKVSIVVKRYRVRYGPGLVEMTKQDLRRLRRWVNNTVTDAYIYLTHPREAYNAIRQYFRDRYPKVRVVREEHIILLPETLAQDPTSSPAPSNTKAEEKPMTSRDREEEEEEEEAESDDGDDSGEESDAYTSDATESESESEEAPATNNTALVQGRHVQGLEGRPKDRHAQSGSHHKVHFYRRPIAYPYFPRPYPPLVYVPGVPAPLVGNRHIGGKSGADPSYGSPSGGGASEAQIIDMSTGKPATAESFVVKEDASSLDFADKNDHVEGNDDNEVARAIKAMNITEEGIRTTLIHAGNEGVTFDALFDEDQFAKWISIINPHSKHIDAEAKGIMYVAEAIGYFKERFGLDFAKQQPAEGDSKKERVITKVINDKPVTLARMVPFIHNSSDRFPLVASSTLAYGTGPITVHIAGVMAIVTHTAPLRSRDSTGEEVILRPGEMFVYAECVFDFPTYLRPPAGFHIESKEGFVIPRNPVKKGSTVARFALDSPGDIDTAGVEGDATIFYDWTPAAKPDLQPTYRMTVAIDASIVA